VLNGFSKAWAMTGWRLGWMVTPKHLVEPMAVLAECNNTGATVFAQAGGLAALQHGEDFVASFVARTRANRDIVMEVIGSHPKVHLPVPEGAFYAFPKIEGLTDSLAFAAWRWSAARSASPPATPSARPTRATSASASRSRATGCGRPF
jgi:aspartate aminotransferase